MIDGNEQEELLARAEEAAARAHAPGSGFRVGAALRAADGRIFTGCNVENSSLGLSVCAERVALFKAVSEGAGDCSAIVVVALGGHDAPPCGACRQVLAELAPAASVTYRSGGELVTRTVPELLPDPFTGGADGC